MTYTRSEVNAIKAACCLSAFIIPLMSTMMNLSLVNIGIDFSVGSHALAYVNTAFLLSSVIFMVPFAKIGDLIGKKRTFFIGLGIIGVACVLGTIAPSFWFVIGCRVLTGMGAAAVATVNISMLTDVTPPERRGEAIGFQTMCTYIGLSIGPVIGGALNDLLGWRVLFALIVPLTIAAVAVLMVFKGEIRRDESGIFDLKGAVLYGLSTLLMMLGIINLSNQYALISIIVGFVLLVLFVKVEKNNPHCLLDMSLFRSRVFSGSCIATFMNYASIYAVSFFLALYLQSIGQLSATQAGALMLLQPAIQAVGTPICGKLSDRMAKKHIMPTIGMALTSVGTLTLVFYDMSTTLTTVVITMVILGLGCSLFSAPNTSIIMSSVPMKQSGEASGMVAVMRQSGMMVSMGIAMMFISMIMGSMDNLCPETYGLFLEVIRTTFILCTIMCIIGTITSAFRGSVQTM